MTKKEIILDLVQRSGKSQATVYRFIKSNGRYPTIDELKSRKVGRTPKKVEEKTKKIWL